MREMNPWLKLAIEGGPLLVFFAANSWGGIFYATGFFMVAIVLALGVSYKLTRKWPMVPLVSAVIVLIFGGLTLYLQDETFIKVKPTILYTLFGSALLFGIATGRSYLKPVFKAGFPPLTDEGWNKLTYRWAAFFLALAVLNEVVWRNVSTDAWVNFKVFAMVPITIVFAFSQMPMVMRHVIEDEEGE